MHNYLSSRTVTMVVKTESQKNNGNSWLSFGELRMQWSVFFTYVTHFVCHFHCVPHVCLDTQNCDISTGNGIKEYTSKIKSRKC
jgi:hypothetical protein